MTTADGDGRVEDFRGVAPFSPGMRLGQRYVLERPIGSGGMSQVWRALDDVLDRAVAVKTLGAPFGSDPAVREAFRREARAAARVSHPHVALVLDFGEATADGAAVPYLVMELIEGDNLADRLGDGPLPWRDAVGACADVASALTAAHRLGVVHRDIKPGNVMLTATGAKVVDFGIAAIVAGGDGDTTGGLGLRAGTPAYLAPEVLTGQPATAASDVYGVGALLCATLTGAPPLRADSWAEALRGHDRGLDPPRLEVRGVPAEVAELGARCLLPSPDARPTIEEVAAVLGRAAGRTPAAKHASTGRQRRPTGVATVPSPALRGATLLEARPPADEQRPQWTRGALLATARRGGRPWLAWSAVAIAVVGLLLIAGAALVDRALALGDPAVAGATTATPSARPSPTPAAAVQPRTPSAAIDAFDAEIARALDAGLINADMARELADQARDLRERLDRRKDLSKRAEDVRERLENRVEDDRLDGDVAARLDRLLAVLIRLVDDD